MAVHNFHQMDWFFGPSTPGETVTGVHRGTVAPRLYRRPARRGGFRCFWDYMTGQAPQQVAPLPAATAPAPVSRRTQT